MKLCCAVVVLGIVEALAMKRLPVFLAADAFSFLIPASINDG
jgi:hypothetical protein